MVLVNWVGFWQEKFTDNPAYKQILSALKSINSTLDAARPRLYQCPTYILRGNAIDTLIIIEN
jgi:hypothetical protein